MLQCHLDRKTGEFVRKTQGYVSKDARACDSFLPDGIGRPDPSMPLVVLIRAKRFVFREYRPRNLAPWQYLESLSCVVASSELLYQHKGMELIMLEAEDGRQSIFNIEYYNAIRKVYSDMTLHLGENLKGDSAFLLVGISEERCILLAPMKTKDIERKELKTANKTEEGEPSDVQSSLDTFMECDQ